MADTEEKNLDFKKGGKHTEEKVAAKIIACFANCRFKASVHAVERRNNEISYVLSLKDTTRKPIAEKLFHHRFCIGKCHKTVSHISRWKHTKFFPKLAAAAAVICHGDNRC